MTYHHFISDLVDVVEGTGATIMVVGGAAALVGFVVALAGRGDNSGAYQQLRQRLGRSILLGLEVLIIGDIVRTIIVDPTLTSVGVLGLIVVIRIVLSFSLEVEIDGVWPWNVGKLDPARKQRDGPPAQ